MPTERHGKVKHLLKNGRATVVRKEPFTIQLLYDTPDRVQSLTLGVDTGSGTIGAAATKENGDIVYLSEVTVRNDITDKMTKRADFSSMPKGMKTPKLCNCRRISARKSQMVETVGI